MDKREKLRKLGFQMAIAGLVVAVFSLLPGVFAKDDFPWTILVGSFFYLNGAFLVFAFSRGDERKRNMVQLRFVRLGFVVVFALLVWKLFG